MSGVGKSDAKLNFSFLLSILSGMTHGGTTAHIQQWVFLFQGNVTCSTFTDTPRGVCLLSDSNCSQVDDD